MGPVDRSLLTLSGVHRSRATERNSNTSSLPCGGIAECHHTHRRGHAYFWNVLPASILLCARSPFERDHPTTSALCVRVAPLGGASTDEERSACPRQTRDGVGRDYPRNCAHEPTVFKMIGLVFMSYVRWHCARRGNWGVAIPWLGGRQ